MVKVELSDADGNTESHRATPIGENLYRLENSPFFAYNVSWQDIIEAKPDEEGIPIFVRVVEKSGNRTIRVILESAESQRILDALIQLGCSYGGANPSYLSVNIPIEANFQAVCGYLIQSGVQWEYADPSYDKLHPNT